MTLTPLQAHALAYYLSHSAKDFASVGRWFSMSYLDETFTDKISVDVRPFGKAAQAAAGAAARFYLDYMIANGGFENKEQKFGGTMHQLQADGYKAALAALQADDPILKEAAGRGEEFWAEAFGKLA